MVQRHLKGVAAGALVLLVGGGVLRLLDVPFAFAYLAVVPLAMLPVVWGRMSDSDLFDGDAYEAATDQGTQYAHWAIAGVVSWVLTVAAGYAAFVASGGDPGVKAAFPVLIVGGLLGFFLPQLLLGVQNREYASLRGNANENEE